MLPDTVGAGARQPAWRVGWAESDARLTEIVTHLVMFEGRVSMSEQVVFGRLGRKFIDEERCDAAEAQQVVSTAALVARGLSIAFVGRTTGG
ncbi:hypothetical protein KCP73_18400 [Salmonella enterica subsp. enterica]|nr:hypothetical protein KCP73_18400 [Salmonella enterica subsp. enterica]